MVAWGPVVDGGVMEGVGVFPSILLHSMPSGIKWPRVGGVVVPRELALWPASLGPRAGTGIWFALPPST